jgi:hypothetical protein
MKRQEEWIDKAMNSTNGLIQAQPSDNLRTKTLLRMKAAAFLGCGCKYCLNSLRKYWSVGYFQ